MTLIQSYNSRSFAPFVIFLLSFSTFLPTHPPPPPHPLRQPNLKLVFTSCKSSFLLSYPPYPLYTSFISSFFISHLFLSFLSFPSPEHGVTVVYSSSALSLLPLGLALASHPVLSKALFLRVFTSTSTSSTHRNLCFPFSCFLFPASLPEVSSLTFQHSDMPKPFQSAYFNYS